MIMGDISLVSKDAFFSQLNKKIISDIVQASNAYLR